MAVTTTVLFATCDKYFRFAPSAILSSIDLGYSVHVALPADIHGSTIANLILAQAHYTERLTFSLHEVCLLYTSPSPRDS